MLKFSDIEYKRPDVEQYKTHLSALTKEIKNAPDYETFKALYFQMEASDSLLSTMFTVASIRNTMDTRDEFYDSEMQYLNEASAGLMPLNKKLMQALLSSKFRPDFEAEFGKQALVEAEIEERVSSSKIVSDLVNISKLSNDYKKTAAGCQVNFMGEECNFYGLLKHMENPDRNIRKSAYEELAKLYEGVSDKLDEIYTDMIKLRIDMAKKLGFDSFTDMSYVKRGRIDYGPAQVANFRKQVQEVIVPACMKIYETQAKRIGVEKLRFYDEMFMFPDSNPDPVGSKDDMVAAAKKMYSEMSSETGEFFDFMIEHDLFDLETRPGKHLGGYCTWLQDYKAPFIFSNFNGTSADVDVLTHEAGHSFAFYTASRTQPFSAYFGSTSEINEIHSMAMEHFAYPWMELFFGENTEKYLYSHLASSLLYLPYMTAVDEFQHKVYENGGAGAEERYSIWKSLEEKYMPWRDYDGNAFFAKGGFWLQKQHIFLYPFYYIDYALAQICSYELFGRMESDRKQAWADYLRLCKAGGSKGYFDLLKTANLSNPFETGTVKNAVSAVVAKLDSSKYSK